MKEHDEPARTSRIDGTAASPDWPAAAEVARGATFKRLESLGAERAPEPADLVAFKRRDVELRSVDDEPAALVYDSDLDATVLSGLRSGSRNVRQLTFEGGDLVLEMEVSGNGRLVGQVVPPQVAEVEVRHRGGTMPLETDELGCFHVQAMPEGPVSFRCRPMVSASNSVATSWITL
jgi:hypothetical protein